MKTLDTLLTYLCFAVIGWGYGQITWLGTHTCITTAAAITCSVHKFDWSIFSRLWPA